MKVPLTAGAYTSRSLIASAQRSVNLYSEHNPEDSPFPATYYPTPGLVLVATAPVAFGVGDGWRGLYTTTQGTLFGVCNNVLYNISPIFQMQVVTFIDSTKGAVSMVDNGATLLLVDGSPNGWTVDLTTLAVRKLAENPDNFYGSDRVDLMDGFFVLNRPKSNQFYISNFQSATFDPLDFVTKTGFSDQVVAVAVTKRTVYVFGSQTTEIWTNTGGTTFPLSRMSGPFIQYGCAAAASVQQMDGAVFWLSKSPQGGCLVLQTQNYDRARISTFAIEKAFQGYGDVSDATAYTYQQEGHSFYVLNFPSANKTWAFDIATNEWHERAFMNTEGKENRQRSCCHAQFNGQNITGDWQNSSLYRLDIKEYTDAGYPIRRIRSFPHLIADSKRVMYKMLIADMEVGSGELRDGTGVELRLRWSDTKGASWGTHISQDLGPVGDYVRSLQFKRLGMARDRVFELSWSGDCKTALSGAYIDLMYAAS